MWIILFNIAHLFTYNYRDRIQSGATTPGQNGPGSNTNEGVLHIPQSFKTGASDCLMSYSEHSLGGTLLLCRDAVGAFYSPSQLGYPT